MAGGQPGTRGRNYVQRADGTRTDMKGADAADVGAGDVLVVETPAAAVTAHQRP
jgi:5-oxoprolinase (ATP-hydrolysing)